jgi:hypothetical protein
LITTVLADAVSISERTYAAVNPTQMPSTTRRALLQQDMS